MEKKDSVKRLCELFEPGFNSNKSNNENTEKHVSKVEKTKKDNSVMKINDREYQRSFLEVTNAEELIELKRDLSTFMNIQIIKMREDNFMDDNESILSENMKTPVPVPKKRSIKNHKIVNYDSKSLNEYSCDNIDDQLKKQPHLRDISDDSDSDHEYEYVSYVSSSLCPGNSTFFVNQGTEETNNISQNTATKPKKDVGSQQPLSPEQRLTYIRKELLSTERNYVEILARIVEVYKPNIEENAPFYLKYYLKQLFGNIDEIYVDQIRFLVSIEYCEEDTDQLIESFIEYKQLFEQYPLYLINGPKSENILPQFKNIIMKLQQQYGDNVDFSAYLLAPLNRLSKYILFLEDIFSQYRRLDLLTDEVQLAINIVKNAMIRGNEGVAIESIQGSPFSSSDHGSLIMSGTLTWCKGNKKDIMVFLFENIVIFTLITPEDSKTFQYMDSIMTNDLCMKTKNYTFHLIDFKKCKKESDFSKHVYVLDAKIETVWKSWTTNIEKLLWKQLHQIKGSTSPNIASNGSNMFSYSDNHELAFSRQLVYSRNSRLLLRPDRCEHPDSSSIFYVEETEDLDNIVKCIENSPIDIFAYGSFIKKGNLQMIKPVKLDIIILLFDNFLVFALEDVSTQDVFHYYSSIKTTDVKIINDAEDDDILKIIDLSKSRPEFPSSYTIVLKAGTVDVCIMWKREIQSIVWSNLYDEADDVGLPPLTEPNKLIDVQPMNSDINEKTSSEEALLTTLNLQKLQEEDNNITFRIDDIKTNFEEETFGLLKKIEAFTLLDPIETNALVFLFENMIIIAIKHETEPSSYQYYQSIDIIDLGVQFLEDNKIILKKNLSTAQGLNVLNKRYILKAANKQLWNEWKYNLENVVYDRPDKNSIVADLTNGVTKNQKQFYQTEAIESSEDLKPLRNAALNEKNPLVVFQADTSPPVPSRRSKNSFKVVNRKSESFLSDKEMFTDTKINKEDLNNRPPPIPARNYQKSTTQVKDLPPLPARSTLIRRNTTPNFKRSFDNYSDSNQIEEDKNLVKSIKNSCIDETAYGQFLMKNSFEITGAIKLNSMVFLFKNVIVFTRITMPHIFEMEFSGYDYVASIEMKDLSFKTISDHTFNLINFTEAKTHNDPVNYTFTLKAETTEITTIWINTIESILWNQLVKMKAETTLPSLVTPFEHGNSSVNTNQQFKGKTIAPNSIAANNNNDLKTKLSFKYSTISEKKYGTLIKKDKFIVMEPDNYTSVVFLYENVILITVYDKDCNIFYCFGSIKLSELSLDSSDRLTIILNQCPMKNKKQLKTKTYVLKAETTEVWKSWMEAIEKLLPERGS